MQSDDTHRLALMTPMAHIICDVFPNLFLFHTIVALPALFYRRVSFFKSSLQCRRILAGKSGYSHRLFRKVDIPIGCSGRHLELGKQWRVGAK